MNRSKKSQERVDRIARYAASVNLDEADPRNKPILDSLGRFYKSNPKARKIANKANERAKYLAASIPLNGPGLFVDRYLRSFLQEYNSRLFRGNGDKQPNSFNVINAFVEPDEDALVLRLLPEMHHTLGLNTLLESLTDPAANVSYQSLMDALEELNIYEYHILGGYSEITFDDFKAIIYLT